MIRLDVEVELEFMLSILDIDQYLDVTILVELWFRNIDDLEEWVEYIHCLDYSVHDSRLLLILDNLVLPVKPDYILVSTW